MFVALSLRPTSISTLTHHIIILIILTPHLPPPTIMATILPPPKATYLQTTKTMHHPPILIPSSIYPNNDNYPPSSSTAPHHTYLHHRDPLASIFIPSPSLGSSIPPDYYTTVNLHKPLLSEFRRLATQQQPRWRKGRYQRERRDCLVAHFDRYLGGGDWNFADHRGDGGRQQRLERWQDLCAELGVEMIPTSITQCRKVRRPGLRSFRNISFSSLHAPASPLIRIVIGESSGNLRKPGLMQLDARNPSTRQYHRLDR